jgi:hypothetical protein
LALPKLTNSAPTQEDWNVFSLGARDDLISIANRFGEGELNSDEFMNEMHAILEELHGEAAFLGRRLAGDLSPYNAIDNAFGKLVAENQREFLEQFAADLRYGRYVDDDGNLNMDMVNARAQSYAGRLRGTADESFVGMSDDDAWFIWHLGGEHNCTECPVIASGSPYTKATLPTMPGANETPCLFNCNCWLEREDGVLSFKPDDE